MSSNVEQIKERLDIVDVLSSYIKMEKAGINYKAKCPFHSEKTPSFFISPARQGYYCFGCGEKGDIFSFVQKFEGLDFKGSLEILAKRAGVELKNFKGEEKGVADEKDKLYGIMEKATKFYEEKLAEDKIALEYLRKRGVSDASKNKWRLGFAPQGWRNLHSYLSEEDFSKEDMLGAGLIKKVPDEQKYYDTFRDRIMFPICDAVGKIIAFSGRALKEDEKTPKYLNSPETKLFYKSEVLYGLNLAKNHIRKLDYAVLVEGQMDLIMSHHAGVLNTVASSGTALTELHLKKIKKLTNKVLIAYDSDSAGEKAAGKAAALALSLGMEAKVASLPEGEDPASVVKENPEKWKAALRQSEHFIDFILEKTVKENQNKNLAKSVAKNVLPFIPLLQSEMEKSQFVKKISLKAKVTEESVWSDLDKIKTGDKNKGVEKTGDYRDEKEAFLFEAERYGLRIDVEKIEEESVKRNELKDLKKNLQEIAATLDDKSLTKEKEREVKSDFERVQKRIKELSKI